MWRKGWNHLPSAQEGTPPPTMIFHRQLEICESDSDASRYHKKNQKDQEQDSVKSVIVVSPDTGVDVVQLDVDGTEW
jgi:hypothetical protein